MRDHLRAFLEFLELNRNASPHTVRAYDSDLTQLLRSLAEARSLQVSELAPADVDREGIRRLAAALR